MKKIVIIFAAMAAVLSSCQKSEIESVSVNDGKDIVLNISVSNPGDESKALIKQGWEVNDQIKIWFDERTTSGTPDLVIKYDGSNWTQDGTAVFTPTSASGNVKAVYKNTVIVASKDAYTLSGNTLTFSIANWTFLTEVQVVVKGLTSASAGSYTLACDKFTPLASTGDGYTVGSDAITASAGTKGAAVTGISNTDGVAFVFATADYSTSSTDKKDFTFTLKDNTSGSEVTKVYKPNVAIEAKTNNAAIKALTIANGNFAVSVPESFVDLGLTSGILWAEKNLGATNPQDYGKYFSWGDVVGQTYSGSSFNTSFNWTNDVFGRTFNKVSQNIACPSGVLASDYDAAYQKDNAWRMPTKEDFTELAKQCFLEWTENYSSTGVEGLIVWKAQNGDAGWFKPITVGKGRKIKDDGSEYYSEENHTFSNTYAIGTDTHLFLPVAGYGQDASLYNAGSTGYYWSSFLFADNTEYAYSLAFGRGFVSPQSDNYRLRGFSVRPVSD